MLILDANNVVSIGESAPAEHLQGKEYTRMFHGYPITAFDHTILVYRKKEIAQKQRKDIGSGESIIMSRSIFAQGEKPHPGHSRLGYDMLYKVDEEGGVRNIAKVEENVLPIAEKYFGTSKSAIVTPTYESSMNEANIVSFLFGISLAHGKWPIKDGTLSPIKITIPLTSSLFGKREIIDMLAKQLHALGFLHTLQYVQSASYEIAQLTIHDPDILLQFAAWMNPVVNIDKISTHEKRQKAFEVLQAYAEANGLSLPIESADKMIILEVD